MVNRGRSTGCNTCKARKVKCDAGKPSCKVCYLAKRQCLGYDSAPRAKVRFKYVQPVDKEARIEGDRQAISTPRRMKAAVPSILPFDESAWGFFVSHYLLAEQDWTSTNGFFEILPFAIYVEHPDSALSVVVAAVAASIYNIWRGDSRLPEHLFRAALRRLQEAIQDPYESKLEATALASMVLQFHDSVRILLGERGRLDRTHHNGTIALLQHQVQGQKISNKDPGYRSYLMQYIVHSEVNRAIRQETPMPETVQHWLATHDLNNKFGPTFKLDLVGLLVHKLQERSSKLFDGDPKHPEYQDQILDLRKEAMQVDVRMQEWAANDVPPEWMPTRIPVVREAEPPIQTYLGGCQIFSHTLVASLWRLSSCYRLITLGIILQTSEILTTTTVDQRYCDQLISVSIQVIFDDICETLPFLMGNRTKPRASTDIKDPNITFPSYHDLVVGSSASAQHIKMRKAMSRDRYNRHLIAHGTWHALSGLSHVLALCHQMRDGPLVTKARPGQLLWMYEQALRAAKILRVDALRFVEPFESTRQKGSIECHPAEGEASFRRTNWLNI